MKSLSASWLGSWKAPWALERAKRRGDPAWALAVISQAWLLGGDEGRWPRATWEVKRQEGPRPTLLPKVFEPRPQAEWVALLRHGSTQAPAGQRGSKEDELLAWCWQALIAGNGAPWMSLGTVLLDRETRARWIPLLGAVDSEGTLLLPPFLEPLLPPSMLRLPQGWWAFLLSHTDGTGCLLPDRSPPPDLPWSLLAPEARACLEPLLLPQIPPMLSDDQIRRWAFQLESTLWMLDPRLRAWGRGRGLSPEAVADLVPPALAMGDPPRNALGDVLGGHAPSAAEVPPGWEPSLRADLEASPGLAIPHLAGDPVLDRVRVRWGGDPPAVTRGYPEWGNSTHPCADPFHWMAEGARACRAALDVEGALRAFTWAHAHFTRLKSPFWIKRAAAEAAKAALLWGDLPGVGAWREAQGPDITPLKELNEAKLCLVRGEWDEAMVLLRSLMRDYPDYPHPWNIYAQQGVLTGQAEWVREALPHLGFGNLRSVLEATLGDPAGPPPENLDLEERLLWEYHRVKRWNADPSAFWTAWVTCPNHPMRLGLGLEVLESRSDQRTPAHLLELQVISDRASVPFHQARLKHLWPALGSLAEPDPMHLLHVWLEQRKRPTWLVWGRADEPKILGTGPRPPEGLFSRLQEDGGLAPMEAQGLIWWGFPLIWEGSAVALALVALEHDETDLSCADVQAMAPWLARLAPRIRPEEVIESDMFLTDGSEPMASVLRELARMAASELPVLILGPTGSGKELMAQEIHRLSGRSGPLVPINCSAFVEGLMESELFGHVKGAFTGADRDRKGTIEAASGGTLFLDEVADLSKKNQSLFLRVLQEHEVRHVGSDRSHHVDMRFIAATHRSLEDLSEAGAFRWDLLFRLQGAVLKLPSLRERSHEFPYLIPRLVARIALGIRQRVPELAPGLPQSLARVPWPGNFRELCHAIERALLRCTGGLLKSAHFPELEIGAPQQHTWEDATRAFQRKLLLETMKQYKFQPTEAARALGLARTALYATAKRLGLELAAEREHWQTAELEFRIP